MIALFLIAFPGLKLYNDYNEKHFTIRSCRIISAKPYSAKGGVGKASFTAGAGMSVRTEDCGKFALDTWDDGPDRKQLAESLRPGHSYRFKFGDLQITILGTSRVSHYVFLK